MDAVSTITDGASSRQDAKVLGLISTGHFMSHFYSLTLPPLFPFLKEAFDVSYTELGVMMALVGGATAVSQVPIGFMVDRLGARMVLTIGLIVISLGYGLVGLAPSFGVVLVLVTLAAIGNSVFHPADYAILNSSISPARMGRAFSIHTFAGHLGSAAAPATMILLSAVFDWRVALVAVGLFGLVVMAAMATQSNSLHDDAVPQKKKKDGEADGTKSASAAVDAGQKSGLALLFSKPILLFFLFFATLSFTSTGLQAFSVSALVTLHQTPVSSANIALSAYLLCSAGGILLGGEITDRTTRHELIGAVAFLLTALLSLVMAWIDLPLFLLVTAMVVMGLGQGVVRPVRDMMLRAAAPSGSVGKVFGFVSAGIAVGSAIAPIPFGWLLDTGRPQWVFYLIAIFMTIAIVTVIIPKSAR
jgi:MFS transporter, FSR family, fosmidomycin resistance protein